MEYHDQPLQFINTHFIQAKDKNAGEYENITTLMGSFATFPLLGMPTVAYLTVHYIYPKVYVFMEKYAEHLSTDPYASRILNTNHFKYVFPGFFCFCIMNFLFFYKFFLVIDLLNMAKKYYMMMIFIYYTYMQHALG